MLLFSASLFALPCTLAPAPQEEGFGPRATHLPDEVVVLPLDLSTGHPIVQVEIDGFGPYPMLFDTGASGSMIDGGLAAELGLPVIGEIQAGDPSDPTAHTLEVVVMPTVALGEARFEELSAASWNRPPALRRGSDRGILGLPAFEDCLFTLDYRASELRIFRGSLPSPAEDPSVVSFHRRDNGLVSLPLELPGEIVVDAHLDSGNMSTVFVPASFEPKLDIVEGSKRTGRGMRASGAVEFVYARLQGDLKLGPLTIADPEIRFDSRMPHANVGRTFLEAAEITVDLAKERMRIVPFRAEEAPADPSGGN